MAESATAVQKYGFAISKKEKPAERSAITSPLSASWPRLTIAATRNAIGTAKLAKEGSRRAKQERIHHSGRPFMTASVNRRRNWFISSTPRNKARPAPNVGRNCRKM